MFVGPNKHFSIVIDEFDGKIVKAWHIENSKGEKSPNLATRSGGKHIDLVRFLFPKPHRSVLLSRLPRLKTPAAPRPTSSAVSIPPCMTKP